MTNQEIIATLQEKLQVESIVISIKTGDPEFWEWSDGAVRIPLTIKHMLDSSLPRRTSILIDLAKMEQILEPRCFTE